LSIFSLSHSLSLSLSLSLSVKVTNGQTDESIFLDTFEFIKSHSILKDELMNMKNAITNGRDYTSPPEHDPISLLFDCSFHLGTSTVFMMDLSYMLETDDEEMHKDIKYAITPFNNIGKLQVIWTPLAHEEDDGSDPDLIPEVEGEDLIGQPWSYRLEIKGATGLPIQTDLAYCQYNFFGETFVTESVEQHTRSPQFNYSYVHHIDKCTKEFIKYLQGEAMAIEVFIVPTVNKERDTISTENPTIRAAIEGRPIPIGGIPPSAPPDPQNAKSRAQYRVELAQAEAAILAIVAKKMEAKDLGCEILMTACPEVQQLVHVRLKMTNPDWPKIEIVPAPTPPGSTPRQQLVLKWVDTW